METNELVFFGAFLLIALSGWLWMLKQKFIAAPDYQSAISAAFRLQSRGFVPVINLLGEHYTDRAKVEDTTTQYFFLIDLIKENKLIAKVSVKPTQIGLAISKELYSYNICRLARRAHNQKVPLEIDMEALKYLDDTLETYWEIPGEFDVRQAIQAYLKRSEEDIEKFIAWNRKVRLVKGAYSESDLDKDEQKRQLFRLADLLCFESGNQTLATVRDKNFIDGVRLAGERWTFFRSHISFQMLYGRADKLKRELLKDGFRVEVYMPVGPWHKALPYVWRRITEVYKSI